MEIDYLLDDSRDPLLKDCDRATSQQVLSHLGDEPKKKVKNRKHNEASKKLDEDIDKLIAMHNDQAHLGKPKRVLIGNKVLPL